MLEFYKEKLHSLEADVDRLTTAVTASWDTVAPAGTGAVLSADAQERARIDKRLGVTRVRSTVEISLACTASCN